MRRVSLKSIDFSRIFDLFFDYPFITMEDKHGETSPKHNEHSSQDDSSYYSEDNTSIDIDQNNNNNHIGTLDKSVGEPMESESFTYKGSASNVNTEANSEKLVLKDSLVLKKKFFIILLSIVVLIFVAQFIVAIAFLLFSRNDQNYVGSAKGDSLVSPEQFPWTHWGDCNVPCGRGFRSRIKKCNKKSTKSTCPKAAYETQTCNTRPCPKGSCCSSISVEFGGPAFYNQSALRGDYVYLNSTFLFGDVFMNKIGSGRYLYKSHGGKWGIGVSTIDEAFGIYHKTCSELCPTDCSNDWRYYNLREFKMDKLIRVSCEEKQCCSVLSFSSKGVAKKQWPGCFGYYRYFKKDVKGAPIYAHFESNMFLIRDHVQNTWKISDGYGKSKSHYISRYYRDGYFCPEDAVAGDWRYFNNDLGQWVVDDSIQLVCGDNG